MDPRLLICCAAVFILVSDVCGECSGNQWQCDDGVCIPHRWHCDGVSDCQDGSDEMDCSCPPRDFECADGSGCVTESLACDGQAQCSDGSDELDCDWRSGCLSRDWKCRNNICIPQDFLCNEVNDCGDNSDEETCGSCGKMKIRCSDGRCLTQRELCDGVAQCTDRRDEPHTCGKSCRNANGGCSHTCVDQTWGAMCICPSGMTLSSNGLDCKDVDECSQSFGPCMHLCTNTPGSFRCLCQNGFKSLGNGSCEAQGFPVKILTFGKRLIGLVNVKTRVFEPLLSIESDPIALTYDIQKNLIFWADNHGNIYKAYNHKSMVLYSGQSGVRSLAVDWFTGQLYWTSVTQKAIFTGTADGSSTCVVISKNTDPGDVVLSPVESFIFWINKGMSEQITIERTAMDGSNRTTLIFVTAQIPKGLTLDVAARRLYWISEFKMSIESIRTDGSGSCTFWNFFQGSPAQSLAVFNGWFYWADEKRLWQAPQNLPSAKYNEFLLKASLPVLTVYHELQQPQGFSPCKNSGCKLCLPSKESTVGFTCLCPEGMLPVAYGSCENFKVAYATATVIYSLEFTGNTTIKTELFTSDEDIQAFDMHWKCGCVVWCNGTGHVKTNRLSQDMSEYILTLKPACIVRVDQKTGNLYWLACDELSIGVSTIGPLHQSISRQLYQARTAILDLFVDWQKGKLYWLEGGQIMRMKLGLIGGSAEAVFSLEENGFGTIAFDRKGNSFLWNGGSFLQVRSLLKARKHSGGKEWVISGSIVAAYEPYVVALFSNVLSVWNRKDQTRVSEVAVENDIVSLSVALREVAQDDMTEDVRPTEVTCKSPLVLCPGSTVCISQSQQCDGKSDCPDGSDEAFCLYMCAKPGEFLCEDRRKCVERNLVCDGHSHCLDGSDEVGCPTAAPTTLTTTTTTSTTSSSLKCRVGSILCKDARECVLYSHVCDGEIDCKDGSDEDDCEQQCKQDQFHCAHGRMCIDKKLVCDGTPQCQDRSDEADCFIRSHDCKHRCDNKTRCIPESFLCDGEKDCVDATDETNCNEINTGNLNLVVNKGLSTLVAPRRPVCRSPSMMCPGTLLCITKTRMCDGKLDCPDGSDEVSCMDTCAKIGDFLCKDRRKCVEMNLVCDGHSHCLDGSDEVTCPIGRSRTSTTVSLKCRVGSKPCQDGRECVMHSHVCDGEMDCKDGSDEVDCELQCKPDQFHCAHGRMCIDKIQVCDGTPQCQDRSDEVDCFTRSHECKHRCDNKTLCIRESFLCDGEKDCVDATDEANCTEISSGNLNLVTVKKGASTFVASRPPVCRSPSIMCPGTSLCISQTRLCDGKLDCPDGSDEVSCIDICAKIGDFLCKDRRKCVERSLVCDGRSHCLDGSDEVGCPIRGSRTSTTASLKCRVGSKPCKDGRGCVLYRNVCDGQMDCKDGSDEQNCKRQCRPGRFQCMTDGRCIEKNQVCDGTPQCLDKSDETGCQKASGICSMRCDWNTHCIPEDFMCNGIKDCQDGTDEVNCAISRPSQASCESPSFLCPGTSVCVSQAQLCDRRRGCPDGSDEASCIDACASPGDFLCKDRKKCVERNLVCDGRSHCFDGSDEVGCPTMAPTTSTTVSLKCRVGSKPCKNVRECVLYSHVCDGEMDCKDGSDEEDCELQCNPGQFQCVQGKKCIDFRQVCDGIPQCLDHSDEVGCWKPTKSCSMRCDGNSRCIPEVFICNGMRDCWDGSDEADCAMPTPPSPCKTPYVTCQGTALCILQQYLCDGRRDCPDGSDERPCLRNCPYRSDFLCMDRKKCVKRNLVCDGRSHCLDGSDEVGCPTTAPTTLMTASLKCRVGSKPCKDGQECVLYSHVCDGEMDCKDGSDEANCSVNCKAGEFQCAHGKKCIDAKQVCDGKPQCQDFSDENDCFVRTKSCSHRCDNKTRCIPENFLCDGERDCVDGTDESDCGYPAKVLDCKSPAVLCSGGLLCIPHTRLCDGKRDCPDGIDEAFCFDRCLNPGDFLCKDRRKCVERNLVCDGHFHCLDGSDEVSCPTVAPTTSTASLRCRVGSKPCKDGRECVLYSHVCDGDIDCKDGSDEDDCEQQCKPDQFHCAHGRMCIDKKLVCDGTPQCQDRSDETDCFTRSHDCKHRCDNQTRCIPESFLCDGEKDCVDATDEANCARVTSSHMDTTTKLVCNAPSVLCQKTSKCLAQSQLCDGKTDCPDGSDERSCIYACPDSGQFLCKDRRKCIRKALVCDGYSHCSDGSDEMQCPSCAMRCDGKVCLTKQQLCDGKPDCRDVSDEKNCYRGRVVASASSPLRCPLGSKPCRNGKECILYSHVCDGEKDCKDGSDEQGCERRCKKGEFQCAHGRKCIDMKLVCDGTPQCQDRSDEINCVKLSEECSHSCDNRTRCIPEAFLCDGEKDCVDGSDEDNCVVEHCPSDRFQCSNGQCVAMILRCDGYADCRDHSDEKGCPQPPHCPAEQLCPHTHECLLKEWFCDGDKDCSDGFDEKNCKVTPLECGAFQWSCASKIQCIPQMWRCDGMKDCDDGSDESGCGQVKCPTHLFRCGNGECVQPDLVCNKVPNCVDGSDEGVGCLKNNCSSISLSCQHYCISTPHGARCGCKTGFRLQSDGLTCTDIDECTEIQPDVCSHNCLNTLGSYLCQCHPEYILEPDGQSCKTSEEPSLLVSGQYELLSLGLRSFSIQALITPGHKSIFSLGYDQKERRVYWVSLEEECIKYAFHGEKNNIGTIVKGVKSDSIAIDWIGRNLYWVDGAAGQILAVRLGSSIVAPQNYIVILDEDLEQPRSLVLLPQKGMMFWSEIGGRAQIERSSMDGSERKVVISHGLSWPVSITVDILTDRLYWTDEKLKCICSATLDGENMRVLQLFEMASPFSVAVFNDFVYWSDTRRRSIQGANKLTGKNRKIVLKRPSQPFGLKVAHPFLQPNVTSPCERLKCSHTCLLAPGLKAVCRCPAGHLLAADGLTCSSPVESSSSFLLLLSPTMITQIFTRSLQETGLKKWPVHRAFALLSINEASNFDLLLKDRTVFLADSGQGSVAKLKLSSSGFRPAGHVLQLKGDLVTALAVDWVSHNLYWSRIRSPQLYVTSPGGKYTLLVLQAELQETISIALHPPTGRLCFTAVSRKGSEPLPQVDCAHMDGSNHTLLWSKAKMPISLAFSDTGTALYWADTGAGSISSIDIDGSNYKEYNTGPAFIVSFARIEDIIFWVTLENGTIKVWYTDGFQPKQMWFEVKTNIVELKAYSKSSQKGTNFCSENNGGCSHLCLPYPSGRTCRCAQDYLSVNGTKCVSNLKCPTGSKACRDGHKCIPAAKFCDQVPDCQDGSDEDCVSVKTKSGGVKSKPPQTEVSVQNLDTRSCDAERCSNHGRCVTVKGEVVCKCEEGYSGDLCQNTGSSRTALALTLTFLFGGALLAAVIMKKRRVQAAGLHATDKEMLVTDKEECTTFSQNFANELYNPEEDPMSPAITTPITTPAVS